MHRLFETPENSVKAGFLAGKKACAEALQGWLKGVNSSSMLHTNDMGRDGLPGMYANFARDVFGYSIDYYSDSINGIFDYLPINRNATPFLANRGNSTLNDPDRNLYNGNISYLTTAVPDVAQLPNTIYPSPMVRHFHYDKLNRITKQETADFDLARNLWGDKTSKYTTNYALDPNGNFLTLNRKDEQPLIMDSLAYSYFTSTKDYYNGQKINRLQQVADRAGATAYTLDFEGTSNYNYDDIGYLTSDSGEEIDSLVWSMYGKLKKVIRAENSLKPDLEFWYDPSGNRLCKIVKPRTVNGDTTKQNKWTFTWYIRDAQGNIMATYLETHDSTNTDASLLMQEFPMYGSSRLGVQSFSDTLSHIRYTSGAFDGDGFYTSSNEHLPITEQDTNKYEYRPLLKQYELSNHLNNVLVTISAKPILNDSSGVVNFRTGDILSVSDYFPYGALLNTRHWNSTNYVFGFNGKTNDNEINGWQDYGMRMFDRQNCRFPTPDPITAKYPMLSPYQFASNRPIDGIDLDGLEHYKVQTSDAGNGNTLIIVSMAKKGLHKPFQVDVNGVSVSKTQNDWGSQEIQKIMGSTFVGADNRLYQQNSNGDPVPISGYSTPDGNMDQWGVHFEVPNLTPNQYKTVTTDVPQNTLLQGANTGGTPIPSLTNQLFNIPTSSTNATASFTYNSKGPEINTFSVTDVSTGNVLFTGSGTDLSGTNINVPSGGQVNVSVTGNNGSITDQYDFSLDVKTTTQQTSTVVANP